MSEKLTWVLDGLKAHSAGPSTPGGAGSKLSNAATFQDIAASSPALPAVAAAVQGGRAIQTTGSELSLPISSKPSGIPDSVLNYSPHKVIVSLPDKKVVVQDASGKVLRTYSAFVGKPSNPTPTGQFRIIENIKPGPSEWYYGGHWLGFDKFPDPQEKGVTDYAGFHGWKYDKDDDDMEKEEPGWKTSTHGCVQLSNEDVADLAGLVQAGDPVTIVNTPLGQ